MKEEWRDIKGYEGLYQVSNLGRVKSLNYLNTGREQFLIAANDTAGYKIVSLCKNSKRKTCTIHKLVATAFIPNPNKLPMINHKDENKANNEIDNLEWCTASYNNSYGTIIQRSMLTRKKNNPNGECYAKTVLTRNKRKRFNAEKRVIQYSKSEDLICEYKSLHEAQRKTGINNRHISECCRGKRPFAGGFIWRYNDNNK